MRTLLAATVSAIFSGLLVFNLCYPAPRGPADNGDFARVSWEFAGGPLGFPRVPSVSDPRYRERFFDHYHRYWRLSRHPRGGQVTTSHLVHLPGRLLRVGQPLHYFDLTLNTFYVALLLGAMLLVTLLRLRTWPPRLSLGATALLMSDGQLSLYLNSFYQEAGAYAFTLVLLCLAHLLWERPTRVRLALFTGAAVLLAGTKFPFTPSVVVAAASILLAWLLAIPLTPARRWGACIALGTIVLAAGVYFDGMRNRYGRDVSYNFVFTGLLPEMPRAARGPFLGSLGFEPGDAVLVGRSYYEPDSLGKTPRFEALLGNSLHLRAIARAALEQPGALAGLIATAFGRTGLYDVRRGSHLGIEALRAPPAAYPILDPWSRLRESFLRGGSAYLGVLALCAGLLLNVFWTRARDWRLFYGLGALGFWAGSAGQVLIAVLGNGAMDLNKHLWLANLFLDVALVLAVSGVGVALWQAASERLGPPIEGSGPSAASPLW